VSGERGRAPTTITLPNAQPADLDGGRTLKRRAAGTQTRLRSRRPESGGPRVLGSLAGYRLPRTLRGSGGLAQVDDEFEGAALRAARDDGAE
jgi:hypothetical protein